jgi:glycerophosphoryl diester phosphodiesterase
MKIVIVMLLMTFVASAGCAHSPRKVDGDYSITWRQTISSADQPTPVMTVGSTEIAVRPLPKAKPNDAPRAALFVGDGLRSKTAVYAGKPYDLTLVGRGGMTRVFVNGYPDGEPLAAALSGPVESDIRGLKVTDHALTDAEVLANFKKDVPHRAVTTVGHRGINKYAPENTRISYVQAVDAHTPIVEMDTALSKDGVIVLMHDPTVNRTTNGKGKVAELTADELGKLDAGSWKDKKYAGEPVPRLTQIADVCRGKSIMMLDLKAEGQGKAIAAWLEGANIARDQVILAPWTDAEGAALRQYVKDVPMIRLTTKVPTDTVNDAYFAKMKQTGFSGFSVSWPYLTKEFVDAAHKNGMKVYVWTVNDNPEIAGSTMLGVDGIITDDAAATSKTIAELVKK